MTYWDIIPMETDTTMALPHQIVPTDDMQQCARFQLLFPHITLNGKYIVDNMDWPNDMEEVVQLLQTSYPYSTNGFKMLYNIHFLHFLEEGGAKGIVLRKKEGHRLCGCIIATRHIICIHENQVETSIINFLALHPDERSNQLTPLLVDAITQQIIRDWNIGTSIFAKYVSIKNKHFTQSRTSYKILQPAKALSVGYISSTPESTKTTCKYKWSCVNSVPATVIAQNLEVYQKRTYQLYEKYTSEDIARQLSSPLYITFYAYDGDELIGCFQCFKVIHNNDKVDMNVIQLQWYWIKSTIGLNIMNEFTSIFDGYGFDIFATSHAELAEYMDIVGHLSHFHWYNSQVPYITESAHSLVLY